MNYVDGTTLVNTLIIIVSSLGALMGLILYSASRISKQNLREVS